MGMGMGLPPAKARDFKGSLRRLLSQLGPDRKLVFLVILLAVGSVTFAVVGPKILGEAVNLVFEGAIGNQMPAGATKEQVIAGLRATRPGPAGRHALDARRHPGRRHRLRRARADPAAARRALPDQLAVRAGCRPTSWPASRTGRLPARGATSTPSSGALPLRYFDSHPRGDVLSRVTNDIDNIGQSLQQTPDPADHVAADDRRDV